MYDVIMMPLLSVAVVVGEEIILTVVVLGIIIVSTCIEDAVLETVVDGAEVVSFMQEKLPSVSTQSLALMQL